MKRFFSMAAFATIVSAGIAAQATAASVTAALDVNSAYVWRGLTFNDGFVLQPYIDVAADGFALNVWGNFDLEDYNDAVESGEFSEVDLTGSYTHTFGPVSASFGVIEYLFPAGADSTGEIFAGIGMDVGAGFSIASKLFYDYDQVEDFYLTASAGYNYSINKSISLGLSGMVSYAGEDFAAFYAGGTEDGLFNYLLTASMNYAVTDALGIGFNINYSDTLDKDVLPEGAIDTEIFGGLSLSYAF